jgi:hypothetical protein
MIDTVWRDGLLYKLWSKGIRGPISDLPVAVLPGHVSIAGSVRCGDASSDEVCIDLGTTRVNVNEKKLSTTSELAVG